ncbi:MAG: helix-turn-helix transcriptional regulator [Peptococcaceae bacterium]|nr:helix-turn-helix transcriptional regulator [Peptococcaceae bacterium]
MDVAEFIRKRITELRLKKNVSERQMSVDLGMGENYIQGITSGNSLPSLKVLEKIAGYFELTLSEFFYENEKTALVQTAAQMMTELNEEDIIFVISLIKRLNNEKG